MQLLDIVKKGVTDRSVVLRIIDSADGTPETGVVYNTSGIDLWYRREGAATVSITEATLAALTTAHADGGFLHVSDGVYRLDLPDAAFATGANYVDIGGTVTGMIVIGGRVRLIDIDLEDTVRLGMTALPNAAAEASGGLYTRGTGAGQIKQDANGRIDANVRAWLDTAASTPTVAGVPNVNAKTWNDLATVALPLVPTTAGRTLDVSAGGEAGVDWANVGTPGSTVALSATTVKTLTDAPADSSGITTLLSRLSSARAGYLDNLSAGAVALEASLQALVTTVGVAGAGLTAADDAVIAAIAALNNLSQANVRTAVGLGSANLDTQLAAIAAYIDTEVAAIKAKTDGLPSDPADASDIAASFASIASTLSGLSTLTAAGVRSAVGLASANLDTQLAAIVGYIDTEVASILAAVDTEVGAIKTATDQLTASQAELSAVPAANASPLEKLAWVFALARNKVTQTATTQTLRNDADSADIAAATVSDDGTTFVRSEFV